MKEFYVVLVIFALINCIVLGRTTGPGAGSGRSSVSSLLAIGTLLLLAGNTLLTFSVLIVIEQVSGWVPAVWLAVALSTATAGLLLLPLSAWAGRRCAVPCPYLWPLLALTAIQVAIFTSLLVVAHAGLPPWPALIRAVFWAICAGFGVLVTIVAFADLRLRLRVNDTPGVWRGLPLELVAAGILALALLMPVGGMS